MRPRPLIGQRSGIGVLTSSQSNSEGGKDYHHTEAKRGVICLMHSTAFELADHSARADTCSAVIRTKLKVSRGCYDVMHGVPGGTIDDLLNLTAQMFALP